MSVRVTDYGFLRDQDAGYPSPERGASFSAAMAMSAIALPFVRASGSLPRL